MAIAGIPSQGEKLTIHTRHEHTGQEHTYDVTKYVPTDSSLPIGNVIVTCTNTALPTRFCTLLPEQIWAIGKFFQLEYRDGRKLQTFTSDPITSVTIS